MGDFSHLESQWYPPPLQYGGYVVEAGTTLTESSPPPIWGLGGNNIMCKYIISRGRILDILVLILSICLVYKKYVQFQKGNDSWNVA